MSDEFLFSENNYGIGDIPKAKPRGRSPMTYNADRSEWAPQVKERSREPLRTPVSNYAKQFTKDCLDILYEEIITNPDASHRDRTAAIGLILAYGHGRPTQIIEAVAKTEKIVIDVDKLSDQAKASMGEIMLLIDSSKPQNEQ